MIRSFSSSGQWRRRSTVEMISAAMSLAVHNHVDKDSMLHPIRPSPPSRYSRSREGSLTFLALLFVPIPVGSHQGDRCEPTHEDAESVITKGIHRRGHSHVQGRDSQSNCCRFVHGEGTSWCPTVRQHTTDIKRNAAAQLILRLPAPRAEQGLRNNSD